MASRQPARVLAWTDCRGSPRRREKRDKRRATPRKGGCHRGWCFYHILELRLGAPDGEGVCCQWSSGPFKSLAGRTVRTEDASVASGPWTRPTASCGCPPSPRPSGRWRVEGDPTVLKMSVSGELAITPGQIRGQKGPLVGTQSGHGQGSAPSAAVSRSTPQSAVLWVSRACRSARLTPLRGRRAVSPPASAHLLGALVCGGALPAGAPGVGVLPGREGNCLPSAALPQYTRPPGAGCPI